MTHSQFLRRFFRRAAASAVPRAARIPRYIRRACGTAVRTRLFGTEILWDPRTDVDVIWRRTLPIAFQRTPTHDIGAFADAVQLRALARLLESHSSIQTVLDIGAYHGGYAILVAALARKRNIRVFAVEPSMSNYAVLKSNVSLNRMEKSVYCINGAILGETGRAFLSGTAMTVRATRQIESAEPAPDSASVPAWSYRDFLNHLGNPKIDLCILDVEGAEEIILRDMDRHDLYPNHLFVELHPFAWTRPKEFMEFLKETSRRNDLRWTDSYMRSLDEFSVEDFYIGPCRVTKSK